MSFSFVFVLTNVIVTAVACRIKNLLLPVLGISLLLKKNLMLQIVNNFVFLFPFVFVYSHEQQAKYRAPQISSLYALCICRMGLRQMV